MKHMYIFTWTLANIFSAKIDFKPPIVKVLVCSVMERRTRTGIWRLAPGVSTGRLWNWIKGEIYNSKTGFLLGKFGYSMASFYDVVIREGIQCAFHNAMFVNLVIIDMLCRNISPRISCGQPRIVACPGPRFVCPWTRERPYAGQ